ncbi:MAG: YeeE/YedE family protein [Candidatus Hodarchaeota archaeon]
MPPFYLVIFLGLSIGIVTGLILQRGRVCSNSAFRNLLLIRDFDLTLIIIIAVSIELIGYQLLAIISIPEFTFVSNPIPFSILFIPLGSLLFGFGTAIAGGCAGGVCYRIGEGSLKSLLAFFGFAAGIGLIYVEPLKSIVENLRNSTNWTINNKVPSLEILFPRWVWTLGALILLIFSIYYYKKHTLRLVHLRPHWTPIISGFLLGVVGTFARFFSTLSGRPFGFSTTDGIGQIFSFLLSSIGIVFMQSLDWAGFFIIGLIVGSLFSSIQIKEFKLKVPSRGDTLRFFGGGLILGTGAMLALGCNFGHILGGLPELGISSVFATVLMILGNWTGTYLLYNIMKQEVPKSTPMSLELIV